MIFQHTHEQVMSGRKTQTRRMARPDDWCLISNGSPGYVHRAAHFPLPAGWVYEAVCRPGGRKHWTVGHTYAVQTGRSQPAVGRIRLTGLRREKLQDITWDDVLAEGIGAYTAAMGVLSDDPPDRRWKFMDLWNAVHGHLEPAYGDVEKLIGTPWDANPDVWVLEFELVE